MIQISIQSVGETVAQIQSALVENLSVTAHAPAALAIPQIQKENGKVSLMCKLGVHIGNQFLSV